MKKVTMLFMFMLSMALVFSVSAIAATTTPAKVNKTMSTTVKKSNSTIKNAVKKVNINSADAAALATISGIGPKKAEAIISYRKANGKFKTVNDLQKVKGIGPKTLEKIKSGLTI
jgi:competence protein ComEA